MSWKVGHKYCIVYGEWTNGGAVHGGKRIFRYVAEVYLWGQRKRFRSTNIGNCIAFCNSYGCHVNGVRGKEKRSLCR